MNITAEQDADRCRCSKCGQPALVLINGRCPRCNPYRACRQRGCTGTMASAPLPHWMNRQVCDTCRVERNW